jgi:hypothetical protein
MTRRLRRIAPRKTGITLALLYGCAGLLFVPYTLLTGSLPPGMPEVVGLLVPGRAFFLLIPVIYALLGLATGYVGSLLYNWIAGFTGGVEFEVEAAAAGAA